MFGRQPDSRYPDFGVIDHALTTPQSDRIALRRATLAQGIRRGMEWPAMSKPEGRVESATTLLPPIGNQPFDRLRAFDAHEMACHEQAPKGRVEWLPGADKTENFWSESGRFRGDSPQGREDRSNFWSESTPA